MNGALPETHSPMVHIPLGSSNGVVSPSRPRHFTSLAESYATQTGHTTSRFFAKAIPHIQRRLPITRDSVVHDNAAGPGTVAALLLISPSSDAAQQHWGGTERPGRMYITDINAAMIDAARRTFDVATQERRCAASITYGVADSSDLAASLLAPETGSLTHSILNFSIFTLPDPVSAVREMRRTLRPPTPSYYSPFTSNNTSSTPGGLAILTCWKRFGVACILHRAQSLIRPDLPPLKIPGPEFLEEGELENVCYEAGFDKSRVDVVAVEQLVTEGPDMQGLKSFMMGDLTCAARKGWTREEVGRWPQALERAVAEEVRKHGGIKFEAWVALAQK